MAFFDKLNQVAKNLGDKTTDVIETTKLNAKIASEQLAANEELLKIGQFYYDRYLNGVVEDEVIEYCNCAKQHLDTVSELQNEVNRIQMQSDVQTKTNTVKYCPNCGAALSIDTKFCNQCGNKV